MKIQKGSTLLVVLVLLIIMLLAGMALFRATDIAALISANTANKQKATQLANRAMVDVMNSFYLNPPAKYPANLSYVSGIPDPENTSKSWTGDESSNNCSENGWTNITGNEGFCYRYIIEKLWKVDSKGNLLDDKTADAKSNVTLESSAKGGSEAAKIKGIKVSTKYRVTINVSGPKNTNTYVQAIYSW